MQIFLVGDHPEFCWGVYVWVCVCVLAKDSLRTVTQRGYQMDMKGAKMNLKQRYGLK